MNVTATLIGQMITFAALVWFVMQFLWEPLTKMMADRSKRIADGLAAAERGRHELQLAEQRSKKHLVEAKQAAAEIIAQANKRSNEIVDEAKQHAKAEGDRQLETARAEIDQELNRAKEQLRSQFTDLVLAAAEKVLERELNAKTHGEFVEKMAEKL